VKADLMHFKGFRDTLSDAHTGDRCWVGYVDLNSLTSTDELWRKLIEEMRLPTRELSQKSRLLRNIGGRGSGVRSDFDIFGRLIRSYFKRSLLLLDEVDRSILEDRKNGYRNFRHLQSLIDDKTANVRIALFGYEGLLAAWESHDFPLFHQRLDRISLGRLTVAEVGELIQKPMEYVGVRVHEKDMIAERMRDATAGMPNLVQEICTRLLRRKRVNDTRTLVMADLESVLNTNVLQQNHQALFGQIEDELSRLIVYLMIQRERQFQLESVLGALHQYKVFPSEVHVKRSLSQLVLYNILQDSGDDEYLFTSKLLFSHLRHLLARDRQQIRMNAALLSVRREHGATA